MCPASHRVFLGTNKDKHNYLIPEDSFSREKDLFRLMLYNETLYILSLGMRMGSGMRV